MENLFEIYVERLKQGKTELLEGEVSPETFAVRQEEGLKWESPISFQGQAYLAEAELVIRLDAAARVLLPCSICNSPVSLPVSVKNFYEVVPLEEIKSGIYHFKQSLIDALYLELPRFAECNQGHCPKRKEMAKYFHQQEGYQPFKDL